MGECRECGTDNKFIHEPYCDKYVPSIDEGLDEMYHGYKAKYRRFRTRSKNLYKVVKTLLKRIRELEEIKLLAEKHMFFTTEIMNHRSKSKKCKKKKCLVCAELELQDVAIVIDLMSALSEKSDKEDADEG